PGGSSESLKQEMEDINARLVKADFGHTAASRRGLPSSPELSAPSDIKGIEDMVADLRLTAAGVNRSKSPTAAQYSALEAQAALVERRLNDIQDGRKRAGALSSVQAARRRVDGHVDQSMGRLTESLERVKSLSAKGADVFTSTELSGAVEGLRASIGTLAPFAEGDIHIEALLTNAARTWRNYSGTVRSRAAFSSESALRALVEDKSLPSLSRAAAVQRIEEMKSDDDVRSAIFRQFSGNTLPAPGSGPVTVVVNRSALRGLSQEYVELSAETVRDIFQKKGEILRGRVSRNTGDQFDSMMKKIRMPDEDERSRIGRIVKDEIRGGRLSPEERGIVRNLAGQAPSLEGLSGLTIPEGMELSASARGALGRITSRAGAMSEDTLNRRMEKMLGHIRSISLRAGRLTDTEIDTAYSADAGAASRDLLIRQLG
ncbi:MAG TPA: hypothetical protein VJC03_07910, partial [bacterium]|nr:hypothetical protein [bacterium]